MATLYVCIAVLVAYCAGIFTPSVAKVLGFSGSNGTIAMKFSRTF